MVNALYNLFILGDIKKMKDTKKSKEHLIAELVESEEKYRIQVEMATDAVFLETVEGRILECNTAGAKMFGYTKEEMVDLTIADLVPEKFVKVLPKIITEKDTTYGKFVSRISKKKDGTIFPTEIATKLINIRKKPRLIAYIRDITERKRTEKKQKSLLKKEREQHLKAEILAKVALILTSKLSLSAVLEEVLRQVKRLVPYSACNISLIEKGGLSNIHSVGYEKYGSKNFVNNFRYPLVKIPLVKEVVKLAKPQLISDTYQNPRWIIFKETSWIRSHLVVPICLGDKVIGLLNLDSKTPDKFVKNDIKKLQPLANAAAIALENARLFEEVRKEIAEHQRVEKALVGSEEKYRTVFENTGTATIIIEEDKTISMANTQSEKLTGYSKDEIENKIKWTDFVIPEDLKMMEKYHRERRKAGEKPPTEYEFRLIDKKGNIKNTFLKIGMIPGSKKSIVSLTDITERKQAEQELRESEARLNEAQRIAQIGSWELDLITNTLYWSDEIYRMFDLKPQQFSSTYEAFLDNIHPDDRAFVDKAYTESVKNKTPYDIAHRLPLKDGTLKFVNERCKTFYDDAGKAVRSIGTIQDITERKKAEERLKKTINATIETVSKTIEAKDPYTSGHQQRVSQFATAIAKELNLSPDKIEGIRIASLIHDIGKIGIPSEILSKPITLTNKEFNLIKDHSQIGYAILKPIDFSYPIAQIVLQHHERIDGSGYDQGLKGNKILLEARIIGVADVVEAMSSHRPYRPALGIDKALEEITQKKGIFYDPEVVDACLKLFKEKGFKFE